ncbi:MAG: hypothetical protein A3C43_01385 [Candidatus Schekmanbacteria bacterium RIFCSPHIGHO2_02_FULL_38_11]|uniref:DUF4321 domain-containing protein n=1 Tax=Candidatus Schekmanbacteria bacterium RIFCSPLOWO2_12_FULL_38_15 TaxID=1817883 RepID=A0A1F7SQ56_9BACT|nr:MAG: hypothetical protein A2043_02575 [Candidatus Schekmanbacteria bacterium GWA2_38_9]OGL48828.1 MAG: hypothetical protein A3H37_11465 [Candidatus Schekmanbacteria bacterium RIFCSPLOWO2_02_FULL_38_14]OGL49771.1 MAG: hypothetical protein A3C43_01385 [Candidatus Schekmanbacteria bacterium RIFCSPHIGHO2_02_FULL_38_11]OGL55324.1 MAG: hypothetical protein A3G31_04800 [Candidatus Schekmanbacteria bacterium RIFCSPLOWO2_12_FULL_38_15]
MKNSSGVWLFIVIVLFGMLIGNFLTELILLIPLNTLTKIFSTGFPISLRDTNFDMKIIQLTFGFVLKINIGSVLGIFLGIYLFRWVSK